MRRTDSLGKSDAGKDWRQEEKGMTEDEMAEWNHWLNGHEFKQTPGEGEGQGSMVCWGSWSCKESDMTQQLNNSNALIFSAQGQKLSQYYITKLFLLLACILSWLGPCFPSPPESSGTSSGPPHPRRSPCYLSPNETLLWFPLSVVSLL